MIKSGVFIVLIGCALIIQGQILEEQTLLTYTRCQVDTHCTVINSNSFCFDNDDNKIGICKCLEGYELLARNRTFFSCLKHANFGEPCIKNIQCQIPLSINAVCDQTTQTCRCDDRSHRFKDGKCYTSSPLNEYCQVDANCWMKDGTFGSCIRGRCTCKFDKQVPAEDGISCIDSKDLGESCTNDAECAITPNSVCQLSCKCGGRYMISRAKDSCLKIATTFFETCMEPEQCSTMLIGSTCLNYTCLCPEGHHGYGSRCYRTAGLGGVCTSVEECIRDSKYSQTINCIDQTCRCLPGVINEDLGCNRSSRFRVSNELLLILVMSVFLWTVSVKFK